MMDDIASAVKRNVTPTMSSSSPTCKSVYVFDKNTLRTLDKFTGCDEDYFHVEGVYD
jgi:hypothetical protein